jgi:hypothetical protein
MATDPIRCLPTFTDRKKKRQINNPDDEEQIMKRDRVLGKIKWAAGN